MIRQATIEDVPEIVRLGSLSLVGGAYENLIADNTERVAQLAKDTIGGAGKVLLCDEDGHVCGLLAFLVLPHPFSGEMTATELMWYVEPEFRKGATGLQLLWEAERVAKEMGAKKFQFTAPSEQVGSIYKRFGYRQIEVAYLKELTECHS